MNQTIATTTLKSQTPTALTGCLAPIDKQGARRPDRQGQGRPKVIKTLKCKTVAEGRFRHLNFIRNLPPYVVDEPPGLFGDDTAPIRPKPRSPHWAPASRSAFMPMPWHAASLSTRSKSSSKAISISPRCGAPATCREKPVGFTDVRAKVKFEADRPREELDALVAHARAWSPVANTFSRPVNLEVALA